ncbi:MAG: RtcB family protein, partial [Pseudomonadota bacterium]
PGALLYKRGQRAAEAHTRKVCPEAPKASVWIAADSDEGRAYWDALQLMRAWTKANHEAIHDLVCDGLGARPRDRFWNEHNFVFRRSDGLYLHGKGATPAWADYAEDAQGLTLIPLNMSEPVLITRGLDKPGALGFAPHGAGRNTSRSAHLRRLEGRPPAEVLAEETAGLDIRFFADTPDLSELPSAYKNADAVRRQIDAHGLAEVVDAVEPIGSIMAGDWQAGFRAERRRRDKSRDQSRKASRAAKRR